MKGKTTTIVYAEIPDDTPPEDVDQAFRQATLDFVGDLDATSIEIQVEILPDEDEDDAGD